MRRASVVLDRETWSRLMRVKEKEGFMKDSEVLRYVIRKGLDAVEREEARVEAARG
ncbi:MAG: hypothetical protein GSR84_04620 [Desulfurococcales archaeon]|nr:hypothetical protein [Desulfurococcales archaeon]